MGKVESSLTYRHHLHRDRLLLASTDFPGEVLDKRRCESRPRGIYSHLPVPRAVAVLASLSQPGSMTAMVLGHRSRLSCLAREVRATKQLT